MDSHRKGAIVNFEMTASCVACKHVMTWKPPPTNAANELPMCPRCFSPMVVESASASFPRIGERQ